MFGRVPVNSTHPEYDVATPEWIRARDVIAGEDAVKAAGVRYLLRLDCKTEEEYGAYRGRASFFNATARTGEGFAGLIFRRVPFLKIPDGGAQGTALPTGVGAALAQFSNDADMFGTSLYGYAKNVVNEVIAVGRAGTLMDWEVRERQAGVSWTLTNGNLNYPILGHCGHGKCEAISTGNNRECLRVL